MCFAASQKSQIKKAVCHRIGVVLVHGIGEVTCSCPVFEAFPLCLNGVPKLHDLFETCLILFFLLETRMFVLNLWKFLAVSIVEEHHQV